MLTQKMSIIYKLLYFYIVEKFGYIIQTVINSKNSNINVKSHKKSFSLTLTFTVHLTLLSENFSKFRSSQRYSPSATTSPTVHKHTHL